MGYSGLQSVRFVSLTRRRTKPLRGGYNGARALETLAHPLPRFVVSRSSSQAAPLPFYSNYMEVKAVYMQAKVVPGGSVQRGCIRAAKGSYLLLRRIPRRPDPRG
jgi:hypothetical protein